MSAAGLTHGGFYGHFDTRDELILNALMRALDGNESGRAVHSGRSGALDYVRGHLTMEQCAETSLIWVSIALHTARQASRPRARQI
jgi:AcrR family transcriptional regulator